MRGLLKWILWVVSFSIIVPGAIYLWRILNNGELAAAIDKGNWGALVAWIVGATFLVGFAVVTGWLNDKLTIHGVPSIHRGVPSIALSNDLIPQQSHNDWQRVPVNTVAPIPLDFILHDADGKPIDGVGIAPADLSRFPRYDAGLLVKDGNVMGGIVLGSAPQGATGQQVLNPTDSAGRSTLSGELRLPNGDLAHGIMRFLFRTGSLPGDYTLTFVMEGGTQVLVNIVATVELDIVSKVANATDKELENIIYNLSPDEMVVVANAPDAIARIDRFISTHDSSIESLVKTLQKRGGGKKRMLFVDGSASTLPFTVERTSM